MRSERKLFIFFLILIVVSCSNKRDSDGFYKSPLVNKKLDLQKTDQFTIQPESDSDHTIGKIRFTFATSQDGNLHAFYDEIKSQFVITNSKGEIQQIISKLGKGPGEILKAEGFNFDEQNRLVVHDQNQRMIKIFSLNGEVISHSRPEESFFYLRGRNLLLNGEKIFASTMDQRLVGNLREEAHKSKLAVVYDYEGRLVDTIGTYDPTVKQTKSYNLFSIINADFNDNRLISSQYYNFRIQIFDLKTYERLAWFGRKTPNFKVGDEYISPSLPIEKIQEKAVGRSSAVSVHPLSDYIVLYFETLTESFFKTENFNDKQPYIVIYDNRTYACYGEVALPFALGNVADDKFYLIEDDNPDNYTVGIYELVEEE